MLRNYYRRYKTTEYKFKVLDLTSHTVLKCHTLEEYAKWNFGTYDFSRLHIMQFTGLHDRYHNEIYTHEVLKTPLLIGEVVFDVEKQKMFIVGKKRQDSVRFIYCNS